MLFIDIPDTVDYIEQDAIRCCNSCVAVRFPKDIKVRYRSYESACDRVNPKTIEIIETKDISKEVVNEIINLCGNLKAVIIGDVSYPQKKTL